MAGVGTVGVYSLEGVYVVLWVALPRSSESVLEIPGASEDGKTSDAV